MVRFTIVVIFCIYISACDSFRAPVLINERVSNVTVVFSNGNQEVVRVDWPPCSKAFIGTGKRGTYWVKGQKYQITRIQVHDKDMETSNHYVNDLLEEERLLGSPEDNELTYWAITSESGLTVKHISKTKEEYSINKCGNTME